MNIDLLSHSCKTTKLLSALKRLHWAQLIDRPTRISCESSTLIDHIYCSNIVLYVHWGILDPGLSDHSLIYVCRKKARPCKEKKTVFIRCYRNFDPLLFSRDISLINWNTVKRSNNVNDMVHNFNFEFMKTVNEHMPFKKKRVRISQAPWVNNELLSMSDRREFLAKEFHKCPCPYHFQLKRDTEKCCIRLNDNLKRDYIETTLERFKHDPKYRALSGI